MPSGCEPVSTSCRVRREASTGDQIATLIEHPREIKSMSHAVDLIDVSTDKDALSVMPWARSDTVSGIDGVRALRAEVGAPRVVAGTLVSGEHLTVRVGTGYPTKIAALTQGPGS